MQGGGAQCSRKCVDIFSSVSFIVDIRSEISYDRSEMVRFQIAAGPMGNRRIPSCLRAEISFCLVPVHSTKLTSSSSGEPSVVETSLSATVTARWTRKEPMIINPWIELTDPTRQTFGSCPLFSSASLSPVASARASCLS
jgi:hypothetical protein